MSARTRLVLALSCSGLALGALAGQLAHPWWAAVLAPAPLVVALRCLPLPVGLVLAAAVGAGARALGALGVEGASMATAALGAMALLPALLADRACVTRRPGLCALALPFTVLAIDAGLRAAELQVAALPVDDQGALGGLARSVGWCAPTLVCAMAAQAVGGLCTLGNWHRPDPLPQEAREASVRRSAVGAALLLGAAFVGAALLQRSTG
ncbi:MAG: hypothetical protein HYS27_24560 [Deltaproteobacteria bacterium]|nr:hypothetical protein [Deltaproteobacteria bacterium]